MEEMVNSHKNIVKDDASAAHLPKNPPGKEIARADETQINRTLVMSANRTASNNRTGKLNQTARKNFSARLALEVFRKKNQTGDQKTKEVNEYFGKNLTRFTNLPINNSAEITADSMPRMDHKYENIEIFNEGGQGIISAARENVLGRIVALKTLRTADNRSGSSRDFIAEAKVTAQLDHPSIIPIYAIGRNEEDHLQLAMKLVNGKTLREHLKNISLNYRIKGVSAFDEHSSLFNRLELFLHVCDALVYAHHKKIMHCDLKPENIMIGEYMEVYLMDWGLAKPIPEHDDDSDWVRPETIAGTPRYLSPEAVVGDRIDERSDIFAMGLILQEITTLQYAVTGEDSTDVMNKIKNDQLNPPIHQFGCRIDPDLIAIIRKATAYHREDRYQSIQELADDLRAYLQGNEISANPDNLFMQMVRLMVRHRTAMLLSVFIAVAIAFATVAFSIYQNLKQTRLLNERNEMINRAYGKCFAATSLLDREILAQEKNINLLSGLAARLLSSWSVRDNRIRFRQYDRSDHLASPANIIYSPWYMNEVSFSEGICKAVPELDPEQIKLRMQQLSPLIYAMRETILESGSELTFTIEDEQIRLRHAVLRGLPVKSIYIGLKEGIQFGYPWRDIYKGTWDPRKRPWYLRGKDSIRPVWGTPYIGLDFNMGLCLPCSARIQDENGRFYGVVGLDLTFSKVAEILHNSGNAGFYVLDSSLIDSRGRIITSSTRKKKKINPPKNGISTEIALDYFAVPKIRHGILEQKFGILSDYETGRGEVLYLFAQMKTLNWICVQKIDFEAYRSFFRRNQLLKKVIQPKPLSRSGKK